MSGVFGLYDRSGDGTLDCFSELFETLDYRGYDGRDDWHGDSVVLGHQHCWETPEEVGEEQPIVVDDLFVSFAGRLDNRREFVDVLPASKSLEEVTDAELFAHAYHEWGKECLERAVGAFAVAAWDADLERLFCAVDKTEIRQLFVGVTEDVVVVGSDVLTVCRHPAITGEPDESALAAHLSQTPGKLDATFYEDVRRLPGGWLMLADDDGVRTERYWHPMDGPDLRGANRGELIGRLRGALRDAVRARMRSVGSTGVMMSGGLDSTTVAGLAASADGFDSPVTYSMVFEDFDDDRLTVDERRRIQDVREMHDLEGQELVCDDASALSNPDVIDDQLTGGPALDLIGASHERLFAAAAADGCRTLLTGHGGNAFNGSKLAYADLLGIRTLPELFRTLRADPMPTRWLLQWYVLAPTFPRLGARYAGTSEYPEWFGPRLRNARPKPTPPGGPSERETFSSPARRMLHESGTALTRAHKFRNGRRQAFRRGITLRMPYLDARVVELAYAIPPHELLDSGEVNGFFRETFEEVLPESVLSIQKGRSFTAPARRGLEREREHLTDVFDEPELESAGYVEPGTTKAQLDSFLDGEDTLLTLWRLYGAERWLQTLESSESPSENR